MKLYLIAGGEYSDYHIRRIVTDKEKAEHLCAEFNSFYARSITEDCAAGMGGIDSLDRLYRIKEYDTDDDQMEMQNEAKRIFGMRDGFEDEFIRGSLVPVDVNQCFVEQYNGVEYIEIIATLPKDISDEKAKKIMYDRIAKFKAERAGL